jgi:hypothetical protein
MRLPNLQTLTWATIAASIASALLLADHTDSGLPLLNQRVEHSSREQADDRQMRPHEHRSVGRRSNGHAPAHPRRDDINKRRGPR